MSFPTQDTNKAAEQLALLTDHYKGKPVIAGILNAMAPSIQAIENMLWDIINKFLLSNSPTGDQLDQIGKLVGSPRGALSDADYLRAVVLQIRVNRSQGLSEDIIQVASLAMNGNLPLPNYVDQPPAAFIIECLNLASPLVVAGLLSHTRSVATRGILHYTTWTPGNDFEWSSRYDSSAGQGVWGSRYNASIGGLWVAGASI